MSGLIEEHFKMPLKQIAADLVNVFNASVHSSSWDIRSPGAPFWFDVLGNLFAETWRPSVDFFLLALINAEVGQSIAVGLGDLRANPATTSSQYANDLALVMRLAVNGQARFEFMRALEASRGRSMTESPISADEFASEAKKVAFSLSLGSQLTPQVVAGTGSPALDRLAFCFLEWFKAPPEWTAEALRCVEAGQEDAEREMGAQAEALGLTVAELSERAGVEYVSMIQRTLFAADYLPRLTTAFQAAVRPLLVKGGSQEPDSLASSPEWTLSSDCVTVDWVSRQVAISSQGDLPSPGHRPRWSE